ncbi:hypothetical protein WR25_00121 isoform A [Diploscapter pachys]|uniref:PH domain-containing protein n=2 Tax=Diploscapter pachys TaxID=2018661 RepID=A0A2A2KSS6_9BILA|nr:hypothetical protein WR25_00121 isoform A [Diploscapter pachys]
MNLQLLKRPRPMPKFRDEDRCIHAQWKIKGFYYRKSGFPKMAIKGEARVQYSSLVIEGKYPKFEMRIPLVKIGYIESEGDILDVRGCEFRILLFGIENAASIRDWLRFLVVRQRVPHSLIGLPFEWQVQPVQDDKRLNLHMCHPLNCFKLW